MEFPSLDKVPEQIRDFYHEIEREVVDEDGNSTGDTEIVAVEKPRGQMVSWDYIYDNLVLTGKPDELIKEFIGYAQNADAWAYHDEFIDWYGKVLQIDATPVYDDEGNEVHNPERTYPPEPDVPPTNSGAHLRLERAKAERDRKRLEPITVDGLTYDADYGSYLNMVSSYGSWDTLVTDPGLISSGLITEDGKIIWTMADNSYQPITKDQLRDVIDAIRARGAGIHVQYQMFRQELLAEQQPT